MPPNMGGGNQVSWIVRGRWNSSCWPWAPTLPTEIVDRLLLLRWYSVNSSGHFELVYCLSMVTGPSVSQYQPSWWSRNAQTVSLVMELSLHSTKCIWTNSVLPHSYCLGVKLIRMGITYSVLRGSVQELNSVQLESLMKSELWKCPMKMKAKRILRPRVPAAPILSFLIFLE